MKRREFLELLPAAAISSAAYYSWQEYRIGAMCIGRDGTIYLGESERNCESVHLRTRKCKSVYHLTRIKSSKGFSHRTGSWNIEASVPVQNSVTLPIVCHQEFLRRRP
jgi:hypothetical protein